MYTKQARRATEIYLADMVKHQHYSEMKIQVKKTADGAGICFSDNGVGNWRNKSICVTGKPGRGLETKKIWGVQVA